MNASTTYWRKLFSVTNCPPLGRGRGLAPPVAQMPGAWLDRCGRSPREPEKPVARRGEQSRELTRETLGSALTRPAGRGETPRALRCVKRTRAVASHDPRSMGDALWW